MSEEYQPPAGPPPPALPEGWKAVWNIEYSTFFYVNLNSKRSQWEPPEGAAPPAGPPPGWYNTGRNFDVDDEESVYCDGNGNSDHPAACGAKEKHQPHKFRRALNKFLGRVKK